MLWVKGISSFLSPAAVEQLNTWRLKALLCLFRLKLSMTASTKQSKEEEAQLWSQQPNQHFGKPFLFVCFNIYLLLLHYCLSSNINSDNNPLARVVTSLPGPPLQLDRSQHGNDLKATLLYNYCRLPFKFLAFFLF